MGTHDLSKIKIPVHYKALKPQEFKFVPLKMEKGLNGEETIIALESDLKLKEYVPIIKDSPLYPFITDDDCNILSFFH